MVSIADIRTDYKQQSLAENEVDQNPIRQFDKWWADALHSEIHEVNAMTLATATIDGKPSARIVLLKGYDENGFVFLPTTTVVKVMNCIKTHRPPWYFSGRSWKGR